jgi:hypothetical protein
MKPSRSTLLYAALALLIGCSGCGGMYAGSLLGGSWGAAAGMAAGTGTLLLCARITISLCGLRTRSLLERIVVGDGKVEATADAVLQGITLYEAAVFPLTDQGASITERQARRTIAYQLAAHDDLPVSVRVAAAAALEAIDQGRDTHRRRAPVSALNQAVRECRAGHVVIRDEQNF